MKILSAFIASCLLGAIASAQTEPAKDNEREQQLVVALTKEVQGQQAVIADNQAKIDAKMVAIAEALRQARIYSTRGR
jgi:hypothetical protein